MAEKGAPEAVNSAKPTDVSLEGDDTFEEFASEGICYPVTAAPGSSGSGLGMRSFQSIEHSPVLSERMVGSFLA